MPPRRCDPKAPPPGRTCRAAANDTSYASHMKTLLHLFYALCLIVPVFINACICFASYRWHAQLRLVMARELEQLRKGRAG